MDGSVADSGQSCGERCFPTGFWHEAWELWHLAWPMTLTLLFQGLVQPVSLMFCGHLGKTELASVALALSFFYITCVSFGRGLAFGADTFFGQTYGSTNKKRCGVYLQRGIIMDTFAFLISASFMLNTETLALLLGQNSEVARKSQWYATLIIPGILPYFYLFMLTRYLANQNSVIPNMCVCLFGSIVNAILHYVFIYQLNLGITGSAIALVITYFLEFITLLLYIVFSKKYNETWPGFTIEALHEWGAFARIIVPSIIMTIFWWLCTESGTFLAGILGEVELGVHSILLQVETFAFMLPLASGGACSTRVGQYLGAGNPVGALCAMRVAIILQAILSIAIAAVGFFLRHYIPMAFSNDENVKQMTEDIFVPTFTIFLFMEGIGGILIGIVRGTGRQMVGAILLLISYYIIALPIGIPLMYLTKQGLRGLWWGYVIGVSLQNILYLFFILRFNWQKEADKAENRAGVTSKKFSTDDQNNERDPLLSEGSVSYESVQDSHLQTSNPSIQEVHVFIPQLSCAQITIRRLAVVLLFGCIIGGAIVCRIFLKLNNHDKWTQLCIPLTNVSMATIAPSNDSLPYCNYTDTATMIF